MTGNLNYPQVSQYVYDAMAANASITVPAGYQIVSLVVREKAGNTMPAGLLLGTTDGGNELFAATSTMAASEIRSSTSLASAYRLGATLQRSAFSKTADTPIYFASATKTITDITQANPAVVTSTAHGFLNGQTVDIAAVVGMVQVNGGRYVVANKSANAFELQGLDSTGFTAYASAGTAGGWNGASLNVTMTMTSFI